MNHLSTAKLTRRGLRYFWRGHLGVGLAAMVATAILVGALTVGDSVRGSLRQQSEMRIGRVDAALVAGDRYFRAALADALTGADAAPVLQLRGLARSPRDAAGNRRTAFIDIHGVDSRFFPLAPTTSQRPPPERGSIYLNQPLAEALGVSVGAEILLRIDKPDLVPRDMAMATIEDVSYPLRATVSAILPEAEFGRFGLRSSQTAPHNLFVSLAWLQEQLALPGRVNLLLAARRKGATTDSQALTNTVNRLLRTNWTLEDVQLRLRRSVEQDLFELTSDRMFLDRTIVDAATQGEQALLGLLVYFVNRIAAEGSANDGKNHATPYSMVAAIGELAGEINHPQLRGLADLVAGTSGLVANQWLADDLHAKAGDHVRLDYFVLGSSLKLQEKSNRFRLDKVVPLAGPAADQSLMPRFPGLADAESCRDWQPGVPIDLKQIRDKDEKYWDSYRGTPKAFLSLAAGRQIFANSYGNLTAIRGALDQADAFAAGLRQRIDPSSLGLRFQDLRSQARAAGTSATDFGGLFLGLSFFLILAALLLVAMLFVFGVEQRSQEIGILLAVGFRRKQVRRRFLAEGLIVCTLGSVLGAALGLGYTQLVLGGLRTLWRDAVGTTSLALQVQPLTVVIGIAAGILMSLLAIAWATRRAFAHDPTALLQSVDGPPSTGTGQPPSLLALGIAMVSVLSAAILMLSAGKDPQTAALSWFGGGALLMVALLAFFRYWLTRSRPGSTALTALTQLGWRNCQRRPGRSLAVVALLASGTFLVVSIQAHRLQPPADPTIKSSATGGFSLLAHTTMPVLRDLNSKGGQDAFGLQPEDLAQTTIVPMRIRQGDDASCLNLSQPQNPSLLGVDAKLLATRKSFDFAFRPDDLDRDSSPWSLLHQDLGPGVVPAIGDAASVAWVLHKKPGESLAYTDENGHRIQVRIVATLANSILQGYLVIDTQNMRRHFPSVQGHRMLLIDTPSQRSEEVAATLTNALQDIGAVIGKTPDRLAAFQQVQNTYLLIFQLLGSFGLLLGSVGLGLVVLRNGLERRAEMAVLGAVGYTAKQRRNLLFAEHALLLLVGLGIGVDSGLLALVPSLRSGAVAGTWQNIGMLAAALGLSGLLWTWLAARLAIPQRQAAMLPALRGE